ncbi:PGF-pre-PGF domain-containing protein [Halobellus sp. H-GB7]|uniref:PGF-pre-PGF domain-containing protein n=1 Tax=Halobellus sp. H-GB7 TaxID=3069756 RepID=UPI0027B43808|nr:PGF-pre-PGF domain-containing protein [Halobellus sp. H-GB7]MDQ2053190.1 PGF-pre-PGF domain-containing protein [Halobellus sp. H-GB7]
MTRTRQRSALRLLVVVVALLTVASAGFAPLAAAQEEGTPPVPPQRFYGTVSSDGVGVADQTVEVTYDGAVIANTTTDSDGYYDLQVPKENGLEDGDTVTISVAGTDASTQATWEPGSSAQVNFTADVATTPTETPDGGDGDTGDGGTGGTGGGGDAPPADDTPEPVSETVDLDQDGAAQVQLSGGTGATSVTVTVPGATGQATVEELPDPPADVPAPPGQYVTGVDISAPDPPEGESATVTITVSQSRLDELGASAEQLAIQHYTDGAWQTLETTVESQDGSEVVLSAQTTGFSPFAVTVQDDQAQVTTTAVDTTEQPDETTEPATQATTTSPPGDDGGPGPLLIAGVVIVILAIVAGAYFAFNE